MSRAALFKPFEACQSTQCGSPAVSPDSVGHNVVDVGQEDLSEGAVARKTYLEGRGQ